MVLLCVALLWLMMKWCSNDIEYIPYNMHTCYRVYVIQYIQGFVVCCFVEVMLCILVDSCGLFNHILQGYFNGIWSSNISGICQSHTLLSHSDVESCYSKVNFTAAYSYKRSHRLSVNVNMGVESMIFCHHMQYPTRLYSASNDYHSLVNQGQCLSLNLMLINQTKLTWINFTIIHFSASVMLKTNDSLSLTLHLWNKLFHSLLA